MSDEPLIAKHGGYRQLKSFQVAQLVYDMTVQFCDRYVERRSRTHDQMVQAARSGVQNIAEGSQASGTSRKMELKLTNVARASLEELKLDYEDFLRQRGLAVWPRDEPLRRELVARRCRNVDEVAVWIRKVLERQELRHGRDGLHGRYGRDGQEGPGEPAVEGPGLQGPGAAPSIQSISSKSSIQSIPSIEPRPQSYPTIAANAALVLIGVATALLDRQIAAQAGAFERGGGFTERLYRTRQDRRHHG
jgi:four helix bundle suffix protein